MKRIDTIYETDFHQVAEVDRSQYRHRLAVRAVLLTDKSQVFLMYVGRHGYHKLPGGGVDVGEDIMQALARELAEEVGCQAKVIEPLGEVVEYRDYAQMKQTSYCYLARQIGAKKANQLEQSEIDNLMSEVLASSIDEAIALIEADKPDDIGGQFIKRRDLEFLYQAKSRLSAP